MSPDENHRYGCLDLHIMVISSDGERETTFDGLTRIEIWISEFTTSEHCLLLVVECNGSKLLPVAHELIFHDNLVYSQLALVVIC